MNTSLHSSEVGSWTVKASQTIEFTIKTSQGIFAKHNTDVLEFGSQGSAARRMVVIDRQICKWYLAEITDYFRAQGVLAHIVALDASEEHKELDALLIILREMEQFGMLRRDEPLIAVGGGVLLDLAGMAAGLYRRGIPYVRVPTTLVGLVDASVGSKTGINFDSRRNRLGSYYPPLAAYLDRDFLKTLPPLELSSGLGEILKLAVIMDYDLFRLLENHGVALIETGFANGSVADDVIRRSVYDMKTELETNLWEKDLKRLVDFGHSFSPIVEMRSIHDPCGGPALTHGQAVALDVQFSAVLSHLRGMLAYDSVVRIAKCASQMMLPTTHGLFRTPLVILEALNDTMKHRNGDQNIPLPRALGDPVFVNDVTFDEITRAVEFLDRLNTDLGSVTRGMTELGQHD